MQEKETVMTFGDEEIAYFLDRYDEPRSIHCHEILGTVADEQSAFQHIQIFDTVKHGRALVLDGFPQISERDGWLYTEAMALPAVLAHKTPLHVLILGGGDGAAASFCTRDPRILSVTIVDLDTLVVELTQKHIPSLWTTVLDKRRGGLLRIHGEDALDFLNRDRFFYDIIVSDITDPNEGESAAHLLTPEFFARVRTRLLPNGILAMQSGEYSSDTKTAHGGLLNLVSQNFAYHLTGAMHIPWFSADWSFTFARNDKPLPDFPNIFVTNQLFKKNRELVSRLRALTRGKVTAMFAKTETDSPLEPGYKSRTCFTVGAKGLDHLDSNSPSR